MSLIGDPHRGSAQPDVIDPSGGANQTRVRAYNERLVMSLVRRHGSLSKAEIARRSGLSAQTVSVIMRSLEADGMLIRGEPVRGRVGQPSIPMRLNPDAVYSFGVKIGRRSADLVLMDFLGTIRLHLHQIHTYPLPDDLVTFIVEGIEKLERQLSPADRKRIAGVGIATPFELWNWAEEVGAPHHEMDRWRNFDLQAAVAARTPHPVFLQNDGTSACGAELAFGVGANYPDFVYFVHRLVHRRRRRHQFRAVLRPHRHGRRRRSAACLGQGRQDDAIAEDRLGLRPGKTVARARHGSEAALVFGRRLDRFRRAARNLDPRFGGSPCPGHSLGRFHSRFFRRSDRRRLPALGAGAPAGRDPQGAAGARPSGRHGSGPRRGCGREPRPGDRRCEPAALLPLSARPPMSSSRSLPRC
ncbi:CRP-like cAMP-binding protein [Sinorhizobium fredii]